MNDNKIYSKLLDILVVLKHDADHFRTYSAQNLTKIIDASIHNKRKEPEGIQRLYSLEKRITEVRELLAEQKTIAIANASQGQ